MLRSVKELHGYRIHAKDGDIGKVDEFFFEDKYWVVRYLVVDIGKWILGRKILISPVALRHPDKENNIFTVDLTKEQIKASPTTDTDKPIARQHEHDLHAHYGWTAYWEPGPFSGELAIAQAEYMGQEEKEGDPHLRSTNIVIKYHVHATDGMIGHVDDFIIDDENWAIKYIIVDTHNWLPGRKVLISLKLIENLNWAESIAYIKLTRESIKNGPEFDPSSPISEDYENKLLDHYDMEKKE
jgi:hypothetical protein